VDKSILQAIGLLVVSVPSSGLITSPGFVSKPEELRTFFGDIAGMLADIVSFDGIYSVNCLAHRVTD